MPDRPIRSFASRRFGSVRLRITLAAAGLVAVALTAASYALVRSVHDSLVGEIRRTNHAQLALVAQQLARGRDPTQLNLPLDPGARGAAPDRAGGARPADERHRAGPDHVDRATVAR